MKQKPEMATAPPLVSTHSAGSMMPPPCRFGTYMGKSGTTRAGYEGNITSQNLGRLSTTANEHPDGFGVFAYYTGIATYGQAQRETYIAESEVGTTTSLVPNFMYNQKVAYLNSHGIWEYTPLKYWPNEGNDNGTPQGVDDQDGDQSNNKATTENNNGGLVSFFAYAPYVYFDNITNTGNIEHKTLSSVPTPKAGQQNINAGTDGIVAISGNATTGDPKLRYVIADDGKTVDLLWGTSSTNAAKAADKAGTRESGVQGSSSADANTYKRAIYDATEVENILNADLQKMRIEDNVSFKFKHALAKIGGSYTGTGNGSDDLGSTKTNGLMVVLDLDSNPYETGGSLEDMDGKMLSSGNTSQDMNNGTSCKYKTKVTIESITITSDHQVIPEQVGQSTFDITNDDHAEGLVNQGVLNLATGKWGLKATDDNSYYSTGSISHTIKNDATGSAELNANIKEIAYTSGNRDEYFKETLPIGVTTVPKNVYKEEAMPLVFIPGTCPILTVNVVYVVRTWDPNLSIWMSEVKQSITKKIAFSQAVELNKQYNLLMHLGLTSVKFSATVSDWEPNSNVTGSTDEPAGPGQEVGIYSTDVEHVYLPINVGQHKLQKLTYTYNDGSEHVVTATSGEKRTSPFTYTGGTSDLDYATATNISSKGNTTITITGATATLRDQADKGDKEYTKEWDAQASISATSGSYNHFFDCEDTQSSTGGGTANDITYIIGNNPESAVRTITLKVGYTDDVYNGLTGTVTIKQNATTFSSLAGTIANITVPTGSDPATGNVTVTATFNASTADEFTKDVTSRCTFTKANESDPFTLNSNGSVSVSAGATTGSYTINISYKDADGVEIGTGTAILTLE